MSDDLIDLARRAIASPHFRPMRGMVGIDGTVILSTSPLVETSEIVEWRDGGTMRRENRECTWEDLRDGGWLPDLLEPATLGCFLSIVLPLCDTEAADLVVVDLTSPDTIDALRRLVPEAHGALPDVISAVKSLCAAVEGMAIHNARGKAIRPYLDRARAALEAAPSPEER